MYFSYICGPATSYFLELLTKILFHLIIRYKNSGIVVKKVGPHKFAVKLFQEYTHIFHSEFFSKNVT